MLSMAWAEISEEQAQAWFVPSDFRKAMAKVNSAPRMEFLEAEHKEHKQTKKTNQLMTNITMSNRTE